MGKELDFFSISFLINFFFLETGFHHIGQAGLELLSSSDLPALGLPKCWNYRCNSRSGSIIANYV